MAKSLRKPAGSAVKHLIGSLGLMLFLLACVPGASNGPAADGPEISTTALATDVITAQPLDAVPAVEPPETIATDLPPAAEVATVTEAQAADLAQPADTAAEPPAAQEPAAEPAPPSSPEEAACLKKGNLWIRAGKSIAYTCVKITKDSGKQCTKGTDCSGSCLARSMTCAPYDPLFGCNEILQDDGVRVTLCID